MRYLELDLVPRVSRIGLGTWQFGSREWGYGAAYARQEAARIVERALELGVTLFDTAGIYALGRSERILGRALAGQRDRAFVATKLFPVLPVAAVVRRLGVERLDLYQVHQPNPLVGDATTMRGMRSLQAAGLVGEVGVSNYSLARWQQAEVALGSRVLSNQVSYSLACRTSERDLIPYARARGRLVIAYSPLAQGFLGGNYTADRPPANRLRRRSRRFRPESFARAAPLLRALGEVADAHDATSAQIALAWTIREPQVAAIPGAASVAQLEANAAAAEIELSPGELAALDETSASYAQASRLP
jgi:aryl-alcohol dehydrogenase-like predicted oxidoreductase